jgi:hypothetical protein
MVGNRKSLNSSFFRALALTFVLFLSGTTVNGQTPAPSGTPVVGTSDWDQWKRNCSLSSDFAKKFISCATSTFR